jgi:hypothetical protein
LEQLILVEMILAKIGKLFKNQRINQFIVRSRSSTRGNVDEGACSLVALKSVETSYDEAKQMVLL